MNKPTDTEKVLPCSFMQRHLQVCPECATWQADGKRYGDCDICVAPVEKYRMEEHALPSAPAAQPDTVPEGCVCVSRKIAERWYKYLCGDTPRVHLLAIKIGLEQLLEEE